MRLGGEATPFVITDTQTGGPQPRSLASPSPPALLCINTSDRSDPDNGPTGGELMMASRSKFLRTYIPLCTSTGATDTEKRKEIRHIQLPRGHHPKQAVATGEGRTILMLTAPIY